MFLPIHEKREEIIHGLHGNQVLIVVGETGSGKTTQLPQFCLQAGFGKRGRIAITQPRRIAATSTAARVADELGTAIGTTVGYKVRFHEKVSKHTDIQFMTDGILLNEILSDKLLKKYQTIIIDEAHERSLTIDFLLGYLRKILPKRPDLKVIISSATIDPEMFSRAFYQAEVIEVSGRLFPVETWYRPLDDEKAASGEYTYVNAAVQVVEEIAEAGDPGDVLIFMPTERDIRETIYLLENMNLYNSVLLPLFSRLTRFQQNRIFSHYEQRKIIVSTNIAETSLTVPGIKYVVDTGLARISKYAPRLRANRLPIEAVSQASADQRKGRCGRVEDGLCIRLFSEEDYLSRQEFNISEIKRANLASVILTMLYLRLGDIERFPFLEPPDKRSINDAYAQLYELGALTKTRELTNLGRKIARLPLEPHISRMIIQAGHEHAQREVAIIASGLSIVDPRERPFEKRDEADKMHTQFVDPSSDFLTLLKLWDQYQGKWGSFRTQNKMRRFCRDHFLSYVRMQEWYDVHHQIISILRDSKIFRANKKPASDDAIHRSVLSGLLCNIALKNEKDGYTAAKNRQVNIFPGSSLFKKGVPWIICHEIVETTRVFARTVAPVSPSWIEEIAPELCRYTYEEPYFDTETMSVRANETVLFFGLPLIENRKVFYSKVDPEDATEIFIREGLVHFKINTKHRFFLHNKKLYEKVASIEAKLRKREMLVDEARIVDFYKNRLKKVSSIHELNRLIRRKKDDRFLYLKESDLLAAQLPEEVRNFPDSLNVGGANFSLRYVFNPGSEDDGITVTLPLKEAAYVQDDTFGWLIPALWEEKIQYLLKNLPKSIRKKFIPVPKHAKKIAGRLSYAPVPFVKAICSVIKSEYGLKIDMEDFREEEIPQHLRMNIEIVSKDNKIISIGRDFTQLKTDKGIYTSKKEKSFLEKQFQKFEQRGMTAWKFGDIPEKIEVAASKTGFSVFGYPALSARKNCVDLKLFPTIEDAVQAHRLGVEKLCEIALEKEFAWLDKELKFSQLLKLLCASHGREVNLKRGLFVMVRDYILVVSNDLPMKKEEFDTLVDKKTTAIRGLGHDAVSVLTETLELYQENDALIEKLSGKFMHKTHVKVKVELKSTQQYYIDLILNNSVTYEQYLQYPRYFRAMRFRIEKAFTDTFSYNSRMKKLNPYFQKRERLWGECKTFSLEKQNRVHDFILMTEEYCISLFAQSLKTLFPVSEKRLEKKLEEIGRLD